MSKSSKTGRKVFLGFLAGAGIGAFSTLVAKHMKQHREAAEANEDSETANDAPETSEDTEVSAGPEDSEN